MIRTPLRHQILQDIADGRPDVGLTRSGVMDLLVREGHVECRGLLYQLTATGRELHDLWTREAA